MRAGGRSSGKVVTVDAQRFFEERERRGAKIVDVEALHEQAVITFPISPNDLISEMCLECMEFISSAARDAAAAIDVLDWLDGDDDAHLVTALKKYVEDTGEALKQIDARLKKRGSSLSELFPDLPARAEDTAAWKDLIGRRDVIAHKILTVDDEQVRQEADRDFRRLHALLRNIHFVPTVTDQQSGRLFQVLVRGTEVNRLVPVQPGSDITANPGSSLILVCEDVQQGMLTFRLGRSPENRALVASSAVGSYRLDIHQLTAEDDS